MIKKNRFAANCSYTILNLYSAELFPTVVRGVGMGFTVVVSRFFPFFTIAYSVE